MLSMCYKRQWTFSLVCLFSQFRPRYVPKGPLTPDPRRKGGHERNWDGHFSRSSQGATCSIAQGRLDICQESDREIVMSEKRGTGRLCISTVKIYPSVGQKQERLPQLFQDHEVTQQAPVAAKSR